MKKDLFLFVWAVLAAVLMVVGCVTTNVGDGQVDAVEAATIRLAVGAAMSARPETIVPAYAVTKTLLAIMVQPEAVQVQDLEAALNGKINNLDLTDMERQSVTDLAALVRVNIQERIAGIKAGQRMVVIQAVIQIAHDTAAARLDLVEAGS